MSRGVSQNLALEFRKKIATGQWATGQRLPTTRALAAEYQVSVNTIQSAFRNLEAHDLVDRRPRRGGFVKVPPGRREMSKATTVGFVGVFAQQGAESDADEWTQRIVRGADQELVEAGYHPSLFSYTPGGKDEVQRLATKIDQAADTLAGMVLFVSPAIYGLLEELDKRDIPWITINRQHEHASQNFVTHDAFTASRLIGRCLARMNVDRIAVVGDPMRPGKTSSDKFFGLLQGYIERGMPSRNIDHVSTDGYFEQDGYTEINNYIDRYGPPRLVFASGDLLALGVIRALREKGLSVPSDVGVIGTTGLKMGEYTHPSLTVLSTPMERMGQEAVRMLLQMSREGVGRLIGRYVSAPLVVRESFPIEQELIDEENADLR